MTEVAAAGSYELRLAALDAANSSELINNNSTSHAIPLIARLFARGRQTIGVFSGSLDPKIYAAPAVVEALGVFLVGRGGRLNIVVEKPASKVSDEALLGPGGMLAALAERFGGSALRNVSLRRARETGGNLSHFLFVDNEGFRLEPDNTKHEAIASFNLPEYAKRLRAPFDRLFEAGETIELKFADSEMAV